ncbi:MAG: N-acyl-D-amino-acid deacylase family protein [Gemmatimonadales bacterium]
MRGWGVAGLGLAVAATVGSAQGPLDVLVRGGSVYDGSGRPPIVADVGVRGDRIVFVGDAALAGVRAVRTIDATGLVVAPGFIDPHTHTDGDLQRLTTRGLAPFLMQGVTTVVVGNDGGGPVDVGAALRRLAGGAGTNVVYLAGHGSIRRAVMGMANRAPTPVELDSMRSLVAAAMRDGAVGLSTGLYYAPGNFAGTEEVVELAKVAAAAGGYYDSHIRDESSYTIGLLGAVDETIRIGREAGIPVHFAHLKALGVDVWGQSDAVIARILAARAAGQRVTADQYPYDASGSAVGASLLPRWAEGGGRDSLRRRFDDPATAPRLEKDMTENLRRRGGPEALLITTGRWKGKRLAAVATELGLEPIKAAIAIIKEGDASVASFNMNESDIERFMRQDFVVTGSDGSEGHPRKYGTFPRKIRHYVLDRGVTSLARMIEASSAQTAGIVGLAERGRVETGFHADLIVFDSTTIAARSTYEQPELLATGMRYVLVGGRVAVDAGRPTGVLAGRPLRRSMAAR